MSVLKWKMSSLHTKTHDRERLLRSDREEVELIGDETPTSVDPPPDPTSSTTPKKKRLGMRERLSISQVLRGKEIRRAELRRKKSRKTSDDEAQSPSTPPAPASPQAHPSRPATGGVSGGG